MCPWSVLRCSCSPCFRKARSIYPYPYNWLSWALFRAAALQTSRGSGNQRGASKLRGPPGGPCVQAGRPGGRDGVGLPEVAGEGLLAGVATAPGVVHLAIRAVADVSQHDRRPGRPGGMPPQRPAYVPVQLAAQVGQVDMAVSVLADDHDVGDGLAPRQLVGVLLVRADEDYRPFGLRDTAGQLVPLVQPGRDAQFQDAD